MTFVYFVTCSKLNEINNVTTISAIAHALSLFPLRVMKHFCERCFILLVCFDRVL